MMQRVLAVIICAIAVRAHAAVPPWVRAAVPQTMPALPPSTPAVVLLDSTQFIVGGDVTTYKRRVVKVLTPAGRDSVYAAAFFRYKEGKASIRGWMIDANGKEHEFRDRDAVEASATSFELYSDVHVKMLRPPSIEVGSIFAYEIVEHDRPFETGTIWRFQETIPVQLARFELVLPPAMPYTTKWVHSAAPASNGPSWELHDIPAIADEPRMPEAASLAGWMGVQWGAPRSWSDVGRWFSELASTRLASNADITAKAQSLAEMRALARFTQLDVRYVAVEIGIGGYQPHAAADVFRNRFGDCKDKATLLRAMLRERGIASHYVIVHTTRGMVDPSFPSIASFNHVIIAIHIPRELAKPFPAAIEHPKLGTLLLFDPTSTTTPFGQLPPYLQASRGLLVTEDGGELIELPSLPPEASGLRRVAKLQLDEQGTLRGTIEETRTGSMAAVIRERLLPLGDSERVRWIESTLAHHLAHYTAKDVTIEGLEDPETPLVVRYALTASDYATRVADLLLVRPRVVGAKGEAIVPAAERKYAYVTEGPSVQTDDVEIVLPSSAALDELPKAVKVDTPHVQYASRSTFENGVLHYRRRYSMLSHVVDRDAIPALNEAFAKIGADERASAVFK